MKMRLIKSKEKIIGLFTGLVETWKPIYGFEGIYEISSFGRVKSLARLRKASRGGFAPVAEKILKQKTSKSGYKVVHLRHEDLEKHPSIHRLVAEAFIPNIENKATVNHIDGNKENNNVSNLEWSTHSEQMEHAFKINLIEVRGEPKFSKQMKLEVLDYYNNNNISISQLASKFGMSERTAGRIVNQGVKPRPTTRILKNGQRIVENILSKEQVEDIKLLRVQGWTLAAIAEKFNRGISQIHRIVNNKSRTTEIE